MPYFLKKEDEEKISSALARYYEDAFDAGIVNIMDNLARSKMGLHHMISDISNDTYASLTKKSNDSFGVMFESQMRMKVNLYFANKSDVANVVLDIAKSGLLKLAGLIPIPVLGPMVSKVIELAASEAQFKLGQSGMAEADAAISAQASQNFYTADMDIAKLVETTARNYKLFGSYVSSIPSTATSFIDIVTLPGAVFKMQATASSIAISLSQIKEYLNAMEERLLQVTNRVNEYKSQLKTKLPDSVRLVLEDIYIKHLQLGKIAVDTGKYLSITKPDFAQPMQEGGATLLAAHIAYASAVGYYDAGENGTGSNRIETKSVVRHSGQTLAYIHGGRR